MGCTARADGQMLNKIEEFFKPDPGYLADGGYVIDLKLLAFLVGCIAIGLPLVMMAGVVLFDICRFQSLSHFYFAPFFGDLFVLGVVMIGTFMIAYRGESMRENWFVTLAGICAFLIALFPTSLRGCEQSSFAARIFATVDVKNTDTPVAIQLLDANANPWPIGKHFELFPASTTIHAASAGIFFVFLAIYVLVVFTRIIDDEHRDENGELIRVKRIRNNIYYTCGAFILFCVAAIGLMNLMGWFGVVSPVWHPNQLTFVLEWGTLWAFGIAWMVKGRFWGKWLMDPREETAATNR